MSEAITCKKCGKSYTDQNPSRECLALHDHQNSACCHYGETEVTPPKSSDTPTIDELIQKLGDICHESYLGCDQNKEAPDGYEYSYSNEVINLLDTPEVRQALLQWHNSKVLEVIGDDDFEFKNGMGKRQSMQVSRNQLRAEQRAKIGGE